MRQRKPQELNQLVWSVMKLVISKNSVQMMGLLNKKFKRDSCNGLKEKDKERIITTKDIKQEELS